MSQTAGEKSVAALMSNPVLLQIERAAVVSGRGRYRLPGVHAAPLPRSLQSLCVQQLVPSHLPRLQDASARDAELGISSGHLVSLVISGNRLPFICYPFSIVENKFLTRRISVVFHVVTSCRCSSAFPSYLFFTKFRS